MNKVVKLASGNTVVKRVTRVTAEEIAGGAVQGEQGPVGPQGLTGATGAQGPKGDAGNTGPAGAAGTQGIQGVPGPAGDAGADGQAGADGAAGASAYELALSEGFLGDLEAWLSSLQGETGPQGAQGLQGPQGEQGPAGAGGEDAVGAWGAITGTLADQLDLAAALSSKLEEVDNSNWAGLDLAVENGGTGASTASAARDNLGLGNVDNTSDAAKPISTATQAALDSKASTSAALPTGGTTGQVLSKVNGTNYNVAWTTPSSGGGFSPWQIEDLSGSYTVGRYYPVHKTGPQYQTNAETESVYNRMYAFPFSTAVACTLDRVAFYCNAAALAGTGNVTVGIYSTGSNGLPDSKLVQGTSSGALNSQGEVTVTISQALTASTKYWVVLLHDGQAANIYSRPADYRQGYGAQSPSATMDAHIIKSQTYASGLPSTFGTPTYTTMSFVPDLLLRFSAVG